MGVGSVGVVSMGCQIGTTLHVEVLECSQSDCWLKVSHIISGSSHMFLSHLESLTENRDQYIPSLSL